MPCISLFLDKSVFGLAFFFIDGRILEPSPRKFTSYATALPEDKQVQIKLLSITNYVDKVVFLKVSQHLISHLTMHLMHTVSDKAVHYDTSNIVIRNPDNISQYLSNIQS